ncbi:MAG: putative ABC exporter domain-containing protein [Armatimonadota bacterium]
MNALWWLTGRVLVNSVRRALQSPTRLIGVLFLVAWWFSIVGANFFRYERRGAGAIEALPSEVYPILRLVVIGGFLVVLVLRLLMSFRPPGNYQGADADVLFSTPVNPKAVLLHRFVIDYVFTLLFPLIVLLFGGRQTWRGFEFLARGVENPALVGRMALGAFLLLSLFGVAASYAIGLAINRDTPGGRRARRWFAILLGAAGAYLLGAAAGAVRSEDSLAAFLALADSWFARVLLFPVTAAADMALGLAEGRAADAWLGLGVLVGGSAALIWAARRQAAWLYDMAARQIGGVQARREAQQRGDMFSIYGLYARQGKLKPRRPPFIYGWRAKGAWAIVWREAVLQTRAFGAMMLMMLVVLAFLSALPFIAEDERNAGAVFFLPVHLLMVFSFALAVAQGGFLETLRRTDVQKPLPFSMSTLCLMDILGKSLLPAVMGVASGLMLLVGMWRTPDYGLAALLSFPALACAVVAVQLIVILNFPHVDDPTQRGFRGMVQFLAGAIAVGPSVVVAIIFALLDIPLTFAAVLSLLFSAGVVGVSAAVCGPLYARFNPAD